MNNASLWFDTTDDKSILEKIKSPKKVVKGGKRQISLVERLIKIHYEVIKKLGKHAEDTLTITSKEELARYIDACIKNGIVALDTETNNTTEPINSKLMGPCLYTPNEKQIYIPINHENINTRERLPNQLTEQDLHDEMQRLIDNNVKIIMHNASFDIRVFHCTCGLDFTCYWDTRVACRILDENESNREKSSLKYQYMLHIDPSHGKYDIENLFDGLEYAIIAPELFALYAATDPFMTYKLYEYQLKEFMKEGHEKLFKLFMNVEMPLIPVVTNMELRGIKIDKEYHKRLKHKYDSLLEDVDKRISIELERLKPQIDEWRKTPDANKKTSRVGKDDKKIQLKSKSEQLEEPVNLGSPSQLAILLYDILKAPVVSRKKPRSTNEEAIDLIYEKTQLDICKLIIERRGIVKILSTYIDNIPQLLALWDDGRIRAGFDQNGTDTGRFTSGGKIKFFKDGCGQEIPGINLQTIPSHNKEIRMLYCADDGKVLVSSDYSAQEPRLTAFMSKDPEMIKAYKEGKDLYAVIASLSFNKPYEECMEFHPVTHVKSVEGAERRSQAKSVLLGLEYGRGATSIGEQLEKTKEEAQKIIDKFFTAFPAVEKWINQTHDKVKAIGYVEDWYGRRRRLPNIFLPKYDFEIKDEHEEEMSKFNPFLECSDREVSEFDKKVKVYTAKLAKCMSSAQSRKVYDEAEKDNIIISSNSNLIAEAERQSVNAIIQGGAATLTKLAMINIDRDEELNRLGFKLLSTIHDEVLGECPEENAEEAAKRLSQVMIDTAKPYMEVPMSCDAEIVKNWYDNEYKASLLKEYNLYIKGDEKKSILPISPEEALEKLINNHLESEDTFIRKVVLG